jgi:glycosyltransferase involved in cell wall biosynthesis
MDPLLRDQSSRHSGTGKKIRNKDNIMNTSEATKKSPVSISVFFPCYNEEENVGRVVGRAKEVLEAMGAEYEIIIVDDGSKDRTGEIADELAKEDSRIKVVHHKPNRGYGGALQSGFRTATKELVFFTDGDGQFDIGEIKGLLGILEPQRFSATEDTEHTEKKYDMGKKYDIVCGYRLKRQDPFMRKLNGWLWTRLVNLLFGMRIRDIDCGFKLFRREVVADMPMSSAGALISAEILARATRKGCKIAQVGVHHYPRTAGKQTGAKLRVILRAFKELFKLYNRIRRGE